MNYQLVATVNGLDICDCFEGDYFVMYEGSIILPEVSLIRGYESLSQAIDAAMEIIRV